MNKYVRFDRLWEFILTRLTQIVPATMSQSELSRRCNLSQQAISQLMLKGRGSCPPVETMQELINGLGLTPKEILVHMLPEEEVVSYFAAKELNPKLNEMWLEVTSKKTLEPEDEEMLSANLRYVANKS